MSAIPYDEFGYFHENAEEFGVPYAAPPVVERVATALADGRTLSALRWGQETPDIVFLHGGAQNAHTWDTVALALGRALLAVDLPGHGHSDGPSPAGGVGPEANAADVAAAIVHHSAPPVHLVGMSLGGLTGIALAARHPHLVASLTLVDVTPGVNQDKAAAITAFVNGPPSFASFDEILARTIEHNPARTVASLRRGILHNAVQHPDGSWTWRYRRHDLAAGQPDSGALNFADLWADLGSITAPVMLVRGMRPQSVVDDADETELRRRQPSVRIERLADAGHSVQGDMPVELARLIEEFTARATWPRSSS